MVEVKERGMLCGVQMRRGQTGAGWEKTSTGRLGSHRRSCEGDRKEGTGNVIWEKKAREGDLVVE